MKKILTIILLLQSLSACSQTDLLAYVQLDMRYYTEDGARYLGTSPELITTGDDPLSAGMRKYPRRFRYLLNKTSFRGIYEKYFPDTMKINRLFRDSLAMDDHFLPVFGLLASPFVRSSPALSSSGNSVIRFSREEMMRVAARFFYCESVLPDSSIRTSICIGRNGIAELGLSGNQSLLEAFCFEAIFEKYYTPTGQKNRFVSAFLTAMEEGRTRYRHLFGEREQYLTLIREHCYRKMETDPDLLFSLLEYYAVNKDNLPFTIE